MKSMSLILSQFCIQIYFGFSNFVQQKLTYSFFLMQTPESQSKITKIKRIVTDNPTIPKCESAQLFFTPKNQPKRKRVPNQMTTSSRSLFASISKLCISTKLTNQNKEKIINATPTMETSFYESKLEFKKRQPKRKLNKVSVIRQQKEKLKNFWSPPKIETIGNPEIRVNQQKKSKKIRLDDFILLRKVGEGSYSKAYLAYEKNIGLICVLKVLSKESIIKNQLLKPFIRQLKVHNYLNHENIIGLYGFFDDSENVYLICEYANDGDLYQYTKNKRRLGQQIQIQVISSMVKQLCNAVLSMHTDYLMHRDIKPQNIFLSFGTVKLGDFGWSVYNMDKALRNTQCGTPLYLAPELVEQNEYSQAVDVWAIGVLTFQILTGQLPFQIYTARDMQKVISQQIYFDMISNEIARNFVQKMLQRNVRRRVEIEDIIDHPFLQICPEQGLK